MDCFYCGVLYQPSMRVRQDYLSATALKTEVIFTAYVDTIIQQIQIRGKLN